MAKPAPKQRLPAEPPRTHQTLWIYVFVFLATFAVYAQVGRFDFVNFDDPDYVTANPHVRGGITAENVAWAFTSNDAANWFPLTRLSHMLDCQLFGLRGGWHHLTNVLLHSLAVLLLFAFLHRSTGRLWPSAWVAFLFALHPLHVESVAWVAERKDVLSALFALLALWSYLRWVERPSLRRYLLVALALGLGLMAKPMIVTLPIVFLLVDIWPLGRGLRWREKLPLFGMSAAAAGATYLVQQSSGAVRTSDQFPWLLRVENGLVSYVVYIARMFWPARLAVFYPYPVAVPVWQAAAAALALRGVGGVGNHLQFAQDEFRNDEDPFEEAGLGDVGDAAIDDGAGVDHFDVALAGAFAGEKAAERREVEEVALAGADHQADVGHEQQHSQLQEAARTAIGQAVAENQRKEEGPDDTEQAADDGSKETLQAERAHAQLKEDDERGQDGADAGGGPLIDAEGAKEPASSRKNKYEEQTKSK